MSCHPGLLEIQALLVDSGTVLQSPNVWVDAEILPGTKGQVLDTLLEFRQVIERPRVRVRWNTGWKRNSPQFTRELTQLGVSPGAIEYLDRAIFIVVAVLLFVGREMALEALQ